MGGTIISLHLIMSVVAAKQNDRHLPATPKSFIDAMSFSFHRPLKLRVLGYVAATRSTNLHEAEFSLVSRVSLQE
jgi:hypothetical protein